MKRLVILMLLLLFPSLYFSQGRSSSQDKKDKKRLDSLCKKTPALCVAYGDLVGGNSVFKNLKEAELKPKETNCFDKKIKFSGLINNKNVSGCYYINTKDGFTARRDDRNKSCDPLMSFEPGYQLNMFSMRGDAFLFQINKKKQRTFLAIPAPENVHGNNTTFDVMNTYNLNNGISELYTTDQYPTHQYRIHESSQNAYYSLFVPYRASQIPVHDYLGMYGTGYYKDQFGSTILSLSMDSNPENYIRIEEIMDISECFDGSSFESLNEESNTAEREISDRKKRDIQNRMNDDATYACNARESLLALESQMQEKSDRATALARSGNVGSQANLRILMEGNDVLDQVEMQKLKLQIKECSLNHSIQQGNISDGQKRQYLAELSCIQRSVSSLVGLTNEIVAAESAHSRNLGKALTEKNRIYIEGIRNIDLGCNADKNGSIKPIPQVKNPIRIRNNR